MDYRGQTGVSFGFPPLPRPVKQLIAANVAVYFLLLVISGLKPELASWLDLHLALIPVLVFSGPLHIGALWQLVSYGFLHATLMHLLFNMLGLWMFGGELARLWGKRKFFEFYFFCLIGAALTTVAAGWGGFCLHQVWPGAPLFTMIASSLVVPTVGASGGLYGLLIAFAVLYPDRQFFVFPLPFMIRARTVVIGWLLIAAAGALGAGGASGVANFAHLGGALFGWLYLRLLPSRGIAGGGSEFYYGLRNRYYRWKRRRAARKFEVYMRKQNGPGGRPPASGNGGKWIQ
jgi:membrane associated rhomboid family serine protease